MLMKADPAENFVQGIIRKQDSKCNQRSDMLKDILILYTTFLIKYSVFIWLQGEWKIMLKRRQILDGMI